MSPEDLLWAWLAVTVISGILEVLTVNLVWVMLAAGGLAAAALAAAEVPAPWQVVAFAVVSAAGLLLVRQPLLRRLQSRSSELRTGIEGLLDAPGVALVALTTESGMIKLSGQEWTARLDPNFYSATDELPAGTPVTVTTIDGVTALVHEAA